jgi:hypothetical protein
MRFNPTTDRLLHLVILVTFSSILARIIQYYLDASLLISMSIAVAIVVQMNNILGFYQKRNDEIHQPPPTTEAKIKPRNGRKKKN